MNTLRIALCSLLFLVAITPLTAQGTYTQIDAPNAINGTFAYGIDTAGDVTGYFMDAGSVVHGFFLSAGNYTTIDYPGAGGTTLFAVNDLGQFVGYTEPPVIGFSYDLQTQAFTTISFPGSIDTYPTGINNKGEVVGHVQATTKGFGFARIGSNYKYVIPPGARSSTVVGVSSSGQLVGYVGSAANPSQNFITLQGVFEHLTIPNAPSAQVQGANPAGSALVGSYQPSSNVYAGFVYQNKVLTTLQFPGSSFTFANGVSDSGEVVGLFIDSSGNVHGFTWTAAVHLEFP